MTNNENDYFPRTSISCM